MASNAKNLAELLNQDSTVAVGDIADGSVTTAKLAADAVTSAKIADDAVTAAKIGTGEVKSDNIENTTSLHLACTYTNGDATVTTSSTSSLVVGMEMSHSHGSPTLDTDHLGGRIPAGAKVLSITNSTTFEMSANALAAGTDITTHFTSGVTKSKIAEGSVDMFKRADHDQDLKPSWGRLHYSTGGNYTYLFIDEYGTRMNMQNGNNGPSAIARLEGSTGHGDFVVRFEPSYLWGFGGLYMGEAAAFDMNDPQWMYGNGQISGFHSYQFTNNSSNNVTYITYWNGSSNSTIQNDSGGTNGADWILWRINGVLKVKPGSKSIVTLQSSGDKRDYIFWNSAQSPCFCRIKQAVRIPSGGS